MFAIRISWGDFMDVANLELLNPSYIGGGADSAPP